MLVQWTIKKIFSGYRYTLKFQRHHSNFNQFRNSCEYTKTGAYRKCIFQQHWFKDWKMEEVRSSYRSLSHPRHPSSLRIHCTRCTMGCSRGRQHTGTGCRCSARRTSLRPQASQSCRDRRRWTWPRPQRWDRGESNPRCPYRRGFSDLEIKENYLNTMFTE